MSVLNTDLKSLLCGKWQIRRSILNHINNQQSIFEGEVTFVEANEGLAYEEAGVHYFEEVATPARRSYFYSFPDDDSAQVWFSDGRFFHDLRLSGEVWSATHLCGNDTYRGCFQLLSDGRWRAVWNVSGPSKSYVSTTEYLVIP